MDGHHLILGQLVDFLTGETLKDTHDERYRQELARLLAKDKGYGRLEIRQKEVVKVKAGDKCALVTIDFMVTLNGRIGMLVKYGPGSLVTRHSPALALSRLVEPYQIPLVVVTNGENAEVLAGNNGKVLSRGIDSIPSRPELLERMKTVSFAEILPGRTEMSSRVVYAFEVDGSCPCDDTVCRI
jgi:hypothetical protein